MDSVADMTLDDLKRFVEQTLDGRLTQLLGAFEHPETANLDDSATWDKVRELAERHRWTPPLNAKSSLQLLREDREA